MSKSPMSKSLLISFFLLFLSQISFAQQSRPFRYLNTIGVDVAPNLRGQSGASLIYKHSLASTTDLEQKNRYALRLLAGYYEEPYGSTGLIKQVVDTFYLYEISGRNKHKFLSLGTELQVRKKRFQFHVGIDLGYEYSTSKSESQYFNLVNGDRFITKQYDGDSKSNTVVASLFAGVSYFFLPRFSVGMEANSSTALEFSKSIQQPIGGVPTQYRNTVFIADLKYFRLLYLSYHFGAPAKMESK